MILTFLLCLPSNLAATLAAWLISWRMPRKIDGVWWYRPRVPIPGATAVTLGPHVVICDGYAVDYLITHEHHHALQARTVAVASLAVAWWVPLAPFVAWWVFVGVSYGLAIVNRRKPYTESCIEVGAYAVSDQKWSRR